ncbi:MAG: reverse transcriptase family protein [Polyangiaceae bacterium]
MVTVDGIAELAASLRVSEPELLWLADPKGMLRSAKRPRLHHYHRGWVPKRSGGYRLIERPKPRLKAIQRRLLSELFHAMPVHEAAHGFVRGRSAVTHAANHCGRAVVVRVDLEDFFTSITHARVLRRCEAFSQARGVARVLAGLCTTSLPPAELGTAPRPASTEELPAFQRHRERVLRRHLPQGAPTSPWLANVCAFGLDQRLQRLGEAIGARYSRYADDLVFSGDGSVSRRADRLVPVIAAIAIDSGFVVNFRKTRVMRRGDRQEVAGIVVNEHPNVRRRDYERLEAILTNCASRGFAEENRRGHPDFRAHLRGKIAWIASVSPRRGDKLLAVYERAVARDPGVQSSTQT